MSEPKWRHRNRKLEDNYTLTAFIDEPSRWVTTNPDVQGKNINVLARRYSKKSCIGQRQLRKLIFYYSNFIMHSDEKKNKTKIRRGIVSNEV